MLANIIIMALILGYCAYIIYKNVKNAKEGKHMGLQWMQRQLWKLRRMQRGCFQQKYCAVF